MNLALGFEYRNWKGEHSKRVVLPSRVYFGATEFHPEPQWLLEALDLEKKATRTFAMCDMREMRNVPVPD